MDVTCERCGTEYEFDETLVSDRGTTVKCTHCGHLFKVHRPGQGEASGGEARAWALQRADGSTDSLASLRELQQRITRGELTEDDRISRSGESWKRLGDIAELQTFFHAARAAQGARQSAPDEDAPTQQDAGPFARSPSSRPAAVDDSRAFAPTVESGSPPPAPLPTDPQSARQGPGRTAKGTVMGVGAPAPEPAPPAGRGPGAPGPSSPPPAGAAAASSTPQATPWAEGPGIGGTDDDADTVREPPAASRGRAETAPAGSGTGADGVATARPGSAPARPAPVRAAATPSPAARPPAERPLRIEEEDHAPPPRRGGRTGLWVVLLLLLGAGVAVALNWPKLAPMLGLAPAEDPLAKFLDRGDELLAEDHIDAYEEAEREYTKATALDEKSPRVLRRLGRVHALWGQALAFRARDLEARAQHDPALEGEAAGLRRSQERQADDARENAEDAVRQDPGSAEAELALADALRLTDDPAGAKRHLDRARDMMTDPTADLHYVTALLAVVRADGDLTAAEDDVRRAVETDAGLVRARLLMARVLLAKGDVAGAKSHIGAVLAQVPGHPRAESLQDAIDRGVPPAAPVVEVLDGGVPDAAAPKVDAGVPLAEQDDEPAVAAADEGGGAGGGGGGAPGGHDYSWYVRRGEELQQRGEVGRARDHFEKARDLRPNGAEALNGLGFLALDRGSHGEALGRFRTASQQGYAEAYIGLGMTYRQMGQHRNALEAYQSYLDRNPRGPSASIAQNQVAALKEKVGDSEPEPDEGSKAPETAPDELPAPEGSDPTTTEPSDPPAVGTEP